MVALYGPMGGSVRAIEFAWGGRYAIEEVLDLIAPIGGYDGPLPA